MSRKAATTRTKARGTSKKGRAAAVAAKLKRVKGKLRQKKPTSTRKTAMNTRKQGVGVRLKAKSVTDTGTRPSKKSKIVRIMGQGQFTVDSKTLKKLNDIDNAIVEMVSKERSDDAEFKKKLTQLSEIVVKNGRPLDPHEIIQSDIILPSADLSVDEAKKLFRGEGVIPEL